MLSFFGLPFGFPWESSNAFLRRGVALFKAGMYWWAVAAFSTAIRKDASNVAAYRWRSQAYMMLGYDKKVEYDYEKIQELEARMPRETPISSVIREEAAPPTEPPRSDEKPAAPNRASTLQETPISSVNREKAKPLTETAEHKEVTPELGDSALTDKPVGLAFARAVMYRSTDYETEEDCDQAIREITEAPAWIRTHAAALYNRGLAYLQKGQHDRAVDDFSESLRLAEADLSIRQPDGSIRPYMNAAEPCVPLRKRGFVYLIQRQWHKAIADFTRILALASDDHWTFSCRGIAFNEIGDHDNAIADSAAAILLNPDFYVSYLNRGYAYWQKGELALAIADYSKAIQLDPTDVRLYEHRAKIYLAVGKPALALDDEIRMQDLLATS
jgi:tetratricopeptide (TPR) repeat protein